MELRRSARIRPQRPQAAAIMATAAAARKNRHPASQAPAPVCDPSPAVSTPYIAAARSPQGDTQPIPERSPQGPPRKDVPFPRVSAANGLSPGRTTRYRQALGMRFNKMSLFDREQYTRYIGEEDGQRGTVDEHYAVVPYGTVSAARPLLAPRRIYHPPYTTPPRFSPGFHLGSPFRHHRVTSELVTPWKRVKRALKSGSVLVVVMCILLALLLSSNPGQLANRLKAVLWPPSGGDSDSDGNASRIFLDPFGKEHVPHLTAFTLSIDHFCNQMDGTGAVSRAKMEISHDVQHLTSWHEQLLNSGGPELRKVAEKYDKNLTEAHIIKAQAYDLEVQMCQLADTLMGKGLVFEDILALSNQLKTYNDEADKIRPSQTASKQSIVWTAAQGGDWDHGLVNDAFGSLQAYLSGRKELAQNMSIETNKTIAPWVTLLERYEAFIWLPIHAIRDTNAACRALNARKWLASPHCTGRSPLYSVSKNSEIPVGVGMAAQSYLHNTQDIWTDYATHMQDGISLLDNLPKLKKDLAAEGTPARMDHLQSLFNSLANQANLTAVLLQDACERKYKVAIDLSRSPKDSYPDTFAPRKIGYCKGCDERAAYSWSSSSSSSFAEFVTDWTKNTRLVSLIAARESGSKAQLTVTQPPGVEQVVDAFPTASTASTITDIVRVVNVLG